MSPSSPKAPIVKAPEIKLGDVVMERYRVVEQIGSGGHSVVFRGEDERLSRPVCIKVFSGLGGESGVGRTSYEHFVQEAFALSRLTHPNTLRIYDFGHLGPKELAGMPLQVCEFMNGGTLSQVIRDKGKQSLHETVRVTTAMCAALAEAHALGIVHRDIKPQNILFATVGSNRLPKLADFGIAKWSGDDDAPKEKRAEDTAIVAGQKLAMYSPSWAAPEQLAGQPVSPSTDIYSLACVAVYMLSAKAIFADEDVYAGYKKRRNSEALVRDALAPVNVPRTVIAVLAKALAFDPKKRLAKVEELSSELTAAVEPTTDEEPRLPPRPPTEEPETVRNPTNMTAETTNPLGKAPQPVAETITPVTAQRPAADQTPAIYHAPAVSAWMTNVPAATGNERRVPFSEVPQPFGDRRVSFVMVTNNTTDIVGSHGAKLRVTLLAGVGGARVVHVKGMTCFVALLGGRPSAAVTLDKSADVALVTPRAQEVGHVRIATGQAGAGQAVFTLGNELVAVGNDDCADPILFDFGPGSDAYFVYTRGRNVPKSGRRG